jgi:Fungal rhodopsin domain
MVGYSAMCSVSAVVGLGQHASDLTTEMFSKALFLELVAQVPGCLAIGMAKVAVSLFLMRIVVEKWYVSLQLTVSNFLLYS